MSGQRALTFGQRRRAFVAGALTLGAAVHSLGCSAAEANPRAAQSSSDVPTVAEATAEVATADKEIVRRAFDAWATGTGGPFDLLSDDATWTIVGRSAAARTYPTKEDFMREVIRPFNARLKSPLVPEIRGLYADGDTVIVHFDAAGIARDDRPYRNTYTWYLDMKDGRIVKATAFFDSIAFDELWTRVTPSADS